MKKSKLPYKMIYLEWVDSSSIRRGWTDIDDINKDNEPLLCRSCGFLLKENKDLIVLSVSIAHGCVNGDVAEAHCPMTIPKCAIVKRRYL